MKLVFTLVAASVLSTLTMDIAGGFLRSTGVTAGVPAGLVGKWVESSINGTVFLDDIRTSPVNPHLYSDSFFTIISLGCY